MTAPPERKPFLFIYFFLFGDSVWLKGHWTTSASTLDFFQKNVEIFIPLEVFTHVVTVY